jgi:hypothetical protein
MHTRKHGAILGYGAFITVTHAQDRAGQGILRSGDPSSIICCSALPVVLLPVHRRSGFSLCSIAFSLQLHALV